MEARYDNYIAAKKGKADAAEGLWTKSKGQLLLPERIRFNTTRVLTVRTDEPMLASAWATCHLKGVGDPYSTSYARENKNLEKALCTYLNSSIGILAIMGIRSNTKFSYCHFAAESLKKNSCSRL